MADTMDKMHDQDVGDPDAGKKTSFGVTTMIAVAAVAIVIGTVIVMAEL